MNAAHLHLLTNHLPVLGTLFGLGLLLFALLRKSDELKKVSLGVFVIIALLAIPPYLSGEPAEHLVENIPGISKAFAEEHEEAAQFAFTGVVILGAASLFGLVWWRRGKIVPSWFATLLLLMALGVFGSMAWTANLGGKIRHPEIHGGNGTANAETTDHHDSDD
jgi:hypothetical protein